MLSEQEKGIPSLLPTGHPALYRDLARRGGCHSLSMFPERQHGGSPPWQHCQVSQYPSTLTLTHWFPRQPDSALGLDLLTNCLKVRERSSHH